MRLNRASLVLLSLALSCNVVGPAPSPAVVRQGACQPTLARVVPPQIVIDAVVGGQVLPVGASPRPTFSSRDAFAASSNWIGNDAFWISLPTDGVFERKYSKLFLISLKSGTFKISGHRTDGDGTLKASASSDSVGSSLEFSAAGCWDLAYDMDGQQARFTLKVVDTP
jgi:hypothetical protein